jgi:hypothetical protein
MIEKFKLFRTLAGRLGLGNSPCAQSNAARAIAIVAATKRPQLGQCGSMKYHQGLGGRG